MFPVPDGAMSEQLQAQLQTQLQAVSAQLTAPGAPFELVSLDLAGQRYPLYKNAPLTLAALIEQGRGFGAKEFLVWQDMRWTYDEFFRHVDRLVMALRQTYGIQRGERVAIAMRNRPEWMAAYAAIILSGAVAVPLNSWGQREELVYGLQDSSPKLLFCDLPRLTHVITDLASLNLPAIVVDAAETARWPGVAHYLDVLDAAALLPSSPSAAAVSEPLAPEDLAMILYTSGTSSHPKGVVSTHRAMVQGIVNMEYFGALFVMTSPERFGAMMAAGFEMTTLMAVPLFHSSGLHALFLSALRTGRRIVVMYKWEVGAVLELIAKERVTQLATAPAMMLQLLGDERFDAADTASLGWIGFGGAGIPERLIELVFEKKPCAIAGIGYGLTETNGPANAATGEAFAHWPRSNGPTSPLFEVRILDD
ncbi:MAG: acyl--CoA ligase, partial [Sterolibacterium sp.]|nr:acyl--CoA ligase [Sterolibacterium sp.]